MGKLRQILSRIIRYRPNADLPAPICTHKHLPQKQQHTSLVANSVDVCQSHAERMCIVCSEVHVQHHCTLNLKVRKEIGEGTLKDFNIGKLMMLPLSGLKCICGTPIKNQPEHAICAACGLASCSEHCHSQWQSRGNCSYSSNFYQKPEGVSMRSILFSNIANIQRARLKQWSLACKSSLSYIACYAKSGFNYVYLQRGYRNYGIPQPQLLQKMKAAEQGLDYITHIQRVCTCECDACKLRGWHSVGNCQFDCHFMADFNSCQYGDKSEIYFECQCDCKFCNSGIVVNRHTKFQCALYCAKSQHQIDKLN